MKLTTIKDEDFINYKKASMFIGTSTCTFKCCVELNIPISVCQNSPLCLESAVDIDNNAIVDRYMKNPFTHAIVFGGLEPFDQFDELVDLIGALREKTNDDIVIYSGYYKNEIEDKVKLLSNYKNIIVKFGRYIPNKEKVFDSVLGVYLANEEQHAEKIS